MCIVMDICNTLTWATCMAGQSYSVLSLSACSKHTIRMQAKLAEAAQAKAEYHRSSGSTNSSSSPELTSVPVGQWAPADGVAAQPWDLDPAEITICKRPDGSDWVLGVGSFGQVS